MVKICKKCKLLSDCEEGRNVCKNCRKIEHKGRRDKSKTIINLKTCIRCDELKKCRGGSSICIECLKKYNKEYREQNKKELKEYKKEYDQTYYAAHKEEKQEYYQTYYAARKEEIQIKRKIRKENNKEFVFLRNQEYHKKKSETDPVYVFRKLVSVEIRRALKSRGKIKGGQKTWGNIGYSPDELVNYIEPLFSSPENLTTDGKVWMTFDNHGSYNRKTWNDGDVKTWTWNLDHIIPQSEFEYADLKDPLFKQCWALSNLRPYSAKQNIIDGATRIRHKKKRKNAKT